MAKRNSNLSLFGEPEVKPETRKEKRAKQCAPLRSTEAETVTMEFLWKENAKRAGIKIHWARGTHTTACGVQLNKVRSVSVIELMTCAACQSIARKVWIDDFLRSNKRLLDRIDEGEEE